VTHGYTEPLARFQRERGLDAQAWRTQYEGEPESTDKQLTDPRSPISDPRSPVT
jgi:hypothetical protein